MVRQSRLVRSPKPPASPRNDLPGVSRSRHPHQATVDAAYDPAQVAKEPRRSIRRCRSSTGSKRRANPAEALDEHLAVDVDQRVPVHSLHRAHATDRPDIAALVALLEPHRDQLRNTPAAAAQLLRGFTLAGTHPALTADGPMAPAEIVSVLLDGIRSGNTVRN
jgi:hypothetical protein